MNMSLRIILGLVVALGLVLLTWWLVSSVVGDPEPEREVVIEPIEPAEPEPPVVEYPVPEPAPAPEPPVAANGDEPVAEPEPPPPPLPPLAESDDAVEDALAAVVRPAALVDWLKPERIVERVVVTVNSLDGPSIPLRFRPVEHIEGLPEIARDDDRLYWHPVNTERYDEAVGILAAMEPADVATTYFRHYPLFQEAYLDLGYPDAYFNDRLVEIIDHLLAGPEATTGYELERPEVLYEFADPALEGESWGRKILLRMGPDHAATVRAWLRELRAELVAGADDALPAE